LGGEPHPNLLRAPKTADYTVGAPGAGFSTAVLPPGFARIVRRTWNPQQHWRKLMSRALVKGCVLAACVISLPVFLAAQEVIHALTGTVSTIDSATHSIGVLQDVGGNATYHNLMNPKIKVDFDKKVEAETVSANAFKDQGAYVIVFYYGLDENRTAVAIKNLGPGPFASTVGTVTKFEKGRSVTVKDQSGASQIFKINSSTVAEGGYGVQTGDKYEVDSGDNVRIVSAVVGGSPTVLFMRTE
jgi:hypothetical protein